MNVEQMAVTRLEVEKQLERKSASIASSISRIKRDLRLPVEPVKSAVRKHPLEVVLGTIAVGIACGWLVVGKRKSPGVTPGSHSPAPLDLEPSEFLGLVRAGRASGLSEEDAVSRALRAKSSLSGNTVSGYRQTIAERLGDQVVDLVDTLIRTGLRVVVREAAGWFAEAVRRDKPTDTQ